jgi:hypothetical protein
LPRVITPIPRVIEEASSDFSKSGGMKPPGFDTHQRDLFPSGPLENLPDPVLEKILSKIGEFFPEIGV